LCIEFDNFKDRKSLPDSDTASKIHVGTIGDSQQPIVCKVWSPPSCGQRLCDFFLELSIFIRVVHPAMVSFQAFTHHARGKHIFLE
jgi:hypothetical protein